MKKEKGSSEAPAWLLEDFKRDGRGRPKRKPLKERPMAAEPSLKAPKQPKDAPQVKVAKPGSKERFSEAMAASAEVMQPDQLISNNVSGPDIKAPSIVVDADRGRVRKSWGLYKSSSMSTAICAFARTGLPEETIIQMMGITNTQFQNWMSSDPDLARDYLTCRATFENSAMARMVEIADAKMDWRCYAYLLEKINPARWGPNAGPASTVETPQEGSVPINLDPAHTVARLDELVAKAKAALVANGVDPEATQPISLDTPEEE